MLNKTQLFRLMGSKYTLDSYIDSIIGYWYKKEFKDQPDFLYEDLDYKFDWQTDIITVTFSNGDVHEIPVTEFFRSDPDNPDPDIVMLWYSDYYDGPLSGLATFNGTKVWYLCEDEDDVTQVRSFAIYELSSDEIAEEEHWHQLFQELVGYHCDFGPMRKQCTTNGNIDKYSKLANKADRKRDYTKNKCLGTFDECLIERLPA